MDSTKEIQKILNQYPNDADLGKAIRSDDHYKLFYAMYPNDADLGKVFRDANTEDENDGDTCSDEG